MPFTARRLIGRCSGNICGCFEQTRNPAFEIDEDRGKLLRTIFSVRTGSERVSTRRKVSAGFRYCFRHFEKLRIEPGRGLASRLRAQKPFKAVDRAQQSPRISCALTACIFLKKPAAVRATCDRSMERLVIILRTRWRRECRNSDRLFRHDV
jgi:hypothetical protein